MSITGGTYGAKTAECGEADFIGPAQAFTLEPDGATFRIRHQDTGAQKPSLLAENVNAWFGDREQSYMIRSMDYGSGRVARALLSDRYRRIDNPEVASAVLPLFAGREEMEVVSGDFVQAGVVISNSEVGFGTVSVQPLVYRLVCTNGM